MTLKRVLNYEYTTHTKYFFNVHKRAVKIGALV